MNLPAESSGKGRETMRLQVYLAHCGVASRRASEKLIAAGRVSVDGTVVTGQGFQVSAGSTVCVDGAQVRPEKALRHVLLYKPEGYVCSLADEKGRAVAADLLKEAYKERLYNVGRLDMYSCGLILFTNDGDFAARLSHPSAEIEKEYIAETSVNIPFSLAGDFEKGIRVDGVFYRCEKAERLSARRMRIVLLEGRNREIRNVFQSRNVGIRRLKRVRIGNIEIGDMKPGEFRELSAGETAGLLKLCRTKML